MYIIENKFTLNAESRTLKDNDTNRLIPIGKQDFLVLWKLCENSGEVVSKENLLISAWEGKIVSQSSLTQSIKNIRQYLGDTGRSQRYIKTVSGKGYLMNPSFLCDVETPKASSSIVDDADSKEVKIGGITITEYATTNFKSVVKRVLLPGIFASAIWGGVSSSIQWYDYLKSNDKLESLYQYKSEKLSIYSEFAADLDSFKRPPFSAVLSNYQHVYLYLHKGAFSMSAVRSDGTFVNKLFKSDENYTINVVQHLVSKELSNE